MFRLLFLTFFGKPRFDAHKVHVHESPMNMTVPLMILAFRSIFGGWFAAPRLAGGVDYFERFLHPVFSAYAPAGAEAAAAPAEGAANPGLEILHALTGWPVIVAVLGLLLTSWLYIKNPQAPARLARSLHALYVLLLNKYFVDEMYLALLVRPLLWISTVLLWHGVDKGVIDGALHGTARAARGSGEEIRLLQSGNARSYATWVVVGAVGFTVLLIGILKMAVR